MNWNAGDWIGVLTEAILIFNRYIGLAVGAYNLRRIGQESIAIQRQSMQLIDKEYIIAA
jgi:hypothetical protein